MDFQIDFGAFRDATSASAPLFATVDGRASALSDEEVVFYDPAADRAHVMTRQVLEAMDLCRPFRSLDEHAAVVARAQPQLRGQEAAVRRVLDGLAGRGLLIEGSAFLARFKDQAPAQAAPFAGFAVRACDRPAQLSRLLDGLLARQQGGAAGHPLTLVDDSTDSAAARQHHALLAGFGDAAGVAVRHVGREAWDGAIQRLARELPGHAAAIRALLGRDPAYAGRRGGGTGKNLLALLTAGHRYALLDDDFLFPLHRHPEYRPGVAFDASAASRTYATPDQALAAGTPGDWLEPQLSVCGLRLGQAANRVEGMELGLRELRGIVPSRMPHANPGARIMATVNGHRGDAGASGTAWLFALDPAARAGFIATRDTYMAALERPAVWHGSNRYQLQRGANFTPFLLDNSQPTPCTSPFGRSEDALFSALLSTWWGEGVVLATPFAVGHLQEGTRDRAAAFSRPETPDVNLCIAELVRSIGSGLSGEDPLQRNAAVVAGLRDLASAGDRALVAYLREFLAYLRTSIVRSLQAVLSEAREPPLYWAADLRKLVEVNGRALADGAAPRFAGWPQHADEAACVAAFRRELTALADGLEAWPQLWALCRERGPDWLLG